MHIIVVGGSIGGLSAAHALLRAGHSVTVLERAGSISAAGAGLGLDSCTCSVLESWGLGAQLKQNSVPMEIEENRIITNRAAKVVLRDQQRRNRSTHWSDIHQMLLNGLPDPSIVKFSHRVLDFQQPQGSTRVHVVVAKGGKEDPSEHVELKADLMVAADGSMSNTRAKFRPDEKRRYSGYCAWRGVMQASEDPEVATAIRQEYRDFGNALYFDIAGDTHAVVYELPRERLNWLWYVNQPEPELQGHSVTVKADQARTDSMCRDAEQTWPPALSKLMQSTAAPFINAIYDKEPLDQLVHGRVVLLGEAAHPTTPHGLRSTNMAIQDAGALGECLADHKEDVQAALQQYQKQRLPATTQEVLFSRWLGQIKQNILQPNNKPLQEDAELQAVIGQGSMDHFDVETHQVVK